MVSNQLNLPLRFSEKDNDLIISDCNQFAVKYINSWPDILPSNYISIIIGSEHSGKSCLLNIWQKKYDAKILVPKKRKNFIDNIAIIEESRYFIIDNIELYYRYQEELLYIINHIYNNKKYLLVSASTQDLAFDIKDLNSRINSANIIKIEEPDSDFIKQILIKRLSNQQLRINSDMVEFIANYPGITHESLYDSITKIIDYLNQKNKLSKKYLKQIL